MTHIQTPAKFRGLQVSMKILQKLECLDLRLNLLEQSKPKVPDDVDAGSPLETLLERLEISLRQIQELCNPRRALQKTWKSSAECDILPELNVIASFKSNVQRSVPIKSHYFDCHALSTAWHPNRVLPPI